MSHEPDIIASRPIGAVAIGSVVIVALSVVAALALLRPAAAETTRVAPPTIGSIETTPILDGDRGRHIAAAQRDALEHGRSVDGGLVELPIDQAIDLLLDGGAP